MFVAKPVTKILNVNPKLNIKDIVLSTMHRNYTNMVAGHLELFGNEVILFLPEHSGTYTPLMGERLNQTGHLKVPEGVVTDSEVTSFLCEHDC